MRIDRERNRSTAFTLVELLVVITIIGVLAGLLVPAVWAAVRRARTAQAESQLITLSAALANFQSKYGQYPPSRLVFHESGYLGTPPNGNRYFAGMNNPSAPIGGRDTGPVSGSPEHAELVERSIRSLRTIFPKVVVNRGVWSSPMPPLGPSGQPYDINGNRNFDTEPILMDGHECLVFFLAGIGDWEFDNADQLWKLRGMGGWHKSPRNPFVAVPLTGPDGSREPAMFEIRSDDLIDDDFDGMPGLLDPIGTGTDARYVAYFAPNGSFYDPRDVQLEDDSIGSFFLPGMGLLNVAGPNPWTTGSATGPSVPRWERPNTYQILSPGMDRRYGPGGEVKLVGGDREFPGDGRRVEEDNVSLR